MEHLLSAHYMPTPVQGTFYICYLVNKSNTWDIIRNIINQPIWQIKKNIAIDEVINRSLSWQGAEPEFKPRFLSTKVFFYFLF